MLNNCITLSNGVKMPQFGLGTWKLLDEGKCIQSVLAALNLGIRLIDTASCYKNEEYIGKALKQFEGFKDGQLKTGNDKGVFITSKAYVDEMGYEETYEACLRSLKRLQIPALDLYLLHWPGSKNVDRKDCKNAKVRVDAWRACIRLLKEGKVRAIGVSNYLSHHMDQLAKDCPEQYPHVNQVELHPLCPCTELRETAKKYNIAIQAYSSLGTGEQAVMDHPVVKEVAKAENKTIVQVLLRWAYQQGLMVIPKSSNLEHMKENIKIVEDSMKISEESMKKLSAIDNRSRVCWNPEEVA